MTPQELLNKAADRQDVLIDYMPRWADKRQHIIIRDWLRDEASRHVHLEGLDGGYDEISVWDHVAMRPEIVAIQPCIRMARLILGTVDRGEL